MVIWSLLIVLAGVSMSFSGAPLVYFGYGVVTAPVQASPAQRTPAKIWRRCGRSQFLKLRRITLRRVAQDPPRNTLWASPKKSSEDSGQGKGRKAGEAGQSEDGHS